MYISLKPTDYIMLRVSIIGLILLHFFSCFTTQKERPNIIIIMADDLGYGEIGVYGQNIIETPHLDSIASQGIVFNQFYSGAPVCAPARCILLTGLHSGHAQVRGNDELDHRGDVWSYPAMIKDSSLEGQAPMSAKTVTIAHLLQEAGYKTSLFGKWGLGYPGSVSTPNSMGFDHFVGYNCQRQAHTLTPVHLWHNDYKISLTNDTTAPRTKLPDDADPYDLDSYQLYDQPDYAPAIIFDSLLSHLDSKREEPFALFWETPIPHVPLQAPSEWINYYVDKLGQEEPYLGDKGYFPCRYPKATYAAMISYFDYNVGRLVTYLKRNNLYHNTLILITSDNGPTYAGGVDPDYFNSAGPFMQHYGRGKGFLHEGGIRVPLIASWPQGIPKPKTTNHIASSQDIYPTVAQAAGINLGDQDIDGISFYQTLVGQESQQQAHDYLYWEFPEYGGQRAIRVGPYKILQKDIHKGNMHGALYDLSKDISEQKDISTEHQDIVMWADSIFQLEHVKSSNRKWQYSLIDDIQ